MNKQITDIEQIIQPLLTRRRALILREAGISEDMLDADLYRDLRESKKEIKRLNQNVAEKDELISKKNELISKKDDRIAALEKENEELRKKLGLLDRPVTTSMNSSLPPSKNPIGTKHVPMTNSLREKSTKKSGGQPGHEGHTRYRSLTPGKIEKCVPQFCPCCGKPVCADSLKEKEVRQLVDMPALVLPVITDYIQMVGTCECGHKLVGEFPDEVKAPVCYGPNIMATVAFLSTVHSIPFKRLAEIMENLFGVHMSQGTISNILKDMRKKARVGCEAIRRKVEVDEVVGADETGVNVNGKIMWMWVFQTALLTYMFIADGRRKEIIDEHFPDGLAKSILISDRLSSYFNVDVKEHQDCLAHLLRNTLYFTLLLPEEPWPVDFMDFLRESIHTKKEEGASMELYDKQKDKLENLLEKEIKCPNKDDADSYEKLLRFRQQMIKHKDNLLTFLKYQNVPADNNSSERAVRPVKTKMKVSGQFKSEDGAQAYANIYSIVQTAVKNGQNPLDALVEVAKYKIQK